jgi:hypothetical protein
LWIAAAHSGGDNNSPTPTAPTSYSNLITGYTGNDNNNHTRMVTAERALQAANTNPGNFTLGSSVTWAANTVAIRGKAAVGAIPSSTVGAITIRNGHTVTVTANVTADQVTVEAGGQLTINNGQTFTLNNSTGTDLTVNGTVVNSGTITNNGAIAFNYGSVYEHARTGGAIPTGTTWDANSTVRFSNGGTIALTGVPNLTIGKMLVTNNTSVSIAGGGSTQTLTISNGAGDDLVVDNGSSLSINANYENLVLSAFASAAIDGTYTSGNTYDISASNTLTTVNGTFVNSGTITGATAAKFVVAAGGTYEHARNGGDIPTATWAVSSTCTVTGITSTLPGSASLSQTFGNFTWNTTGQTAWPSGNIAPTNMQVAGNLTVAASGPTNNIRDFAINQANPLTIGGNLIITGGRFTVCYTTTTNQTRTVNVNGDVLVSGGELTITSSTAANNTGILNVDGNIVVSGGTLNLSNEAQLGTIYAKGNYTHSAGTVTTTGTNTLSTIYFAGNGTPQVYTSGGTVTGAVNFVVSSGAYLQMANASTVVSGGGSFATSAGSSLGITAAAGITASGATGNVQVTGTRSYDAGATYIYNGSAAQVTGNGLPATVAGLTFNNAAGVTLSQSVAVSSLATFTNGIVSLAGNTFTVNGGANVSGASDASFVNGPVTKAGAVDAAGFEFPIGLSGLGYMPIKIANVAAGTSFTANYVRASAKAAFGVAGLSELGLQGVSNCEYWTLNRTGGTSTANITMYWNEHSPCNGNTYVANPPFGLRIVHFNTTDNKWDAHGGGAITGGTVAGSITWNNVSEFSPFALGALSGSQSALPVMYDNVKAYAKGTGVQIEWSNLTERELIKYDVQRSTNGADFTSISTHLPKSNRNDKADYTDFDAAPAQGTNYYRIKAYEIGGKLVYSKILRVEIGGSTQARFSVYPNPATGNQITVGLNNLKQGQYTLRIVNAAGQDIHKQVIVSQGSSMTQTLQLPATARSGMYTMLISGDNFKESKVFIIK